MAVTIAIITYENAEGATTSYKKFQTSSIGMRTLKVRPYVNRAEEELRKKRRVKLCNVPYTITEEQVMKLLKPFAEIDEIVFLYYPY